MRRLLFIDDEEMALDINKRYFEQAGYEVLTAQKTQEALEIAREKDLDCIILDIILSQEDGYQVCEALKKQSSTPIIFLSNLSSEESRIQGFSSGGDDYVVKPFSLRELELRIAVRIKSHIQSKVLANVIKSPPLEIDLDSRTVILKGEQVNLVTMEFNVLVLLARNANMACNKTFIYEHVWKQMDLGDPHTVQVHVGRMRKKLDKICPEHHFIQTVWGVGYKFVPYTGE